MLDDRDITIIIPTRNFDQLTKKCVHRINALHPETPIIVLTDSLSDDNFDIKNLVIVPILTAASIAKKRNVGVGLANTKLIGFIDSDAYPDTYWLSTALKILNSNNKVNIISGPNLCPLESPFGERLIGLCEKSFCITLNAKYVKQKGSEQFVTTMPSCNLIIKKNLYERSGGMSEHLTGGEDFDFCIKLQCLGQDIFYHPEVAVYHKSRNVMGFFLKRFSYGGFIADNILKLLISGSYKTILPACFLVLALFFFLFSTPPFVYGLWALCCLCFLAVMTYEVWRISENILDVLLLFPLLFLGILLPGIGTLLKLIRIFPKYEKIYKNFD